MSRSEHFKIQTQTHKRAMSQSSSYHSDTPVDDEVFKVFDTLLAHAYAGFDSLDMRTCVTCIQRVCNANAPLLSIACFVHAWV
jgi:hypothetical protein